jgi:hypothetical protein
VYLEVGWKSVAAPALFSWLAAHARVDLHEHAISRVLLRETGLAIRLANDLADGGREADEGKVNAVYLLCRARGATAEEARALLGQRTGAHLQRARRVASQMQGRLERWARAVLGTTAYLVDAYGAHGDLVVASSGRARAGRDL